ncbi:phage tail length tape measure family protein, partial [Pseudomonas chengduensis]
MSKVSDRLIQLTLRARDFLSKDLKPASEAVKELAEEGRHLKEALTEAGKTRDMARMLRDNQSASDGLAKAWEDARATLEDLTREYSDNERATAGQRIALREARQTAETAEQAYKRNQSTIRNLASELEALGVDTKNAAAEEKRLAGILDEGRQALNANRDAIKRKREEERGAARASAELEVKQRAAAEAARELLQRQREGAQTTAEHSNQIGISIKRLAAYAAGLLGVGQVLSKLREGITAVFRSGNDNEQALAQLNAALASTGNAAGLTAEQLQDLAEQLRSSSLFSTEQIVAAETRLLSYTDVAAEEFPRAMQIVVDQAQRLGMSIEQSAETV